MFRDCASLKTLDVPNLSMPISIITKKVFFGTGDNLKIFDNDGSLYEIYRNDKYTESSSSTTSLDEVETLK